MNGPEETTRRTQDKGGQLLSPSQELRENNREQEFTAGDPCLLGEERPRGIASGQGLYCAVQLGPIGQRIIHEVSSDDMDILRAGLTSDDGPREVVIGHLPLRTCDYALLIAERLPGGYAVRQGHHSFGPGTPYEWRDRIRAQLARQLFDIDLAVPSAVYRYLDAEGNDVSGQYRKSSGWP